MHNRVEKRRLVEDNGKTRWIYRDEKVVDVNWDGDKVGYSCVAL